MKHAIATMTVVVTMLTVHSTVAEQRKSSSPEVRGYRAIQNELSKRTPVPLRLPAFIPLYENDENPLFAILESAGADGYNIQLAWTEDCNGGNVCHLGEIRGNKRPFATEGRRIPVVLSKGIRGFFIDATCGAHCDDAAIYWSQDGYYYSIAMKAEKKTNLVKMANSALGDTAKK